MGKFREITCLFISIHVFKHCFFYRLYSYSYQDTNHMRLCDKMII